MRYQPYDSAGNKYGELRESIEPPDTLPTVNEKLTHMPIREILEGLVGAYPANPAIEGLYQPKTTNKGLLDQAEAALTAYVEKREHHAALSMFDTLGMAELNDKELEFAHKYIQETLDYIEARLKSPLT